MSRHVRIAAVPFLLLTWPFATISPAESHPDESVVGDGFAITADRRMFAVMAFMNANGFDVEAEGTPMHPVRRKVRDMVATTLNGEPEKRERWRRFYSEWSLPSWCYQDFALALSPDYPFHRVRPDAELHYPATVDKLRDFPAILNEFWKAAKLDEVWTAVKPEYQQELRKYDLARMRREFDYVWQYLRMNRTDGLLMITVPNLLDEHYSGIGARYGDAYYSVESPGAQRYGLNIHEYLHSIVNNLIKTRFANHRERLEDYYLVGRTLPMAQSYQDALVFTYESLVRALDHRIRWKLTNDPAVRARLDARVEEITKKGLTLAQPFYLLLDNYEKAGLPFDRALPELLRAIPPYRASTRSPVGTKE